jgi:hypothetical protein
MGTSSEVLLEKLNPARRGAMTHGSYPSYSTLFCQFPTSDPNASDLARETA